MKGKISTAALIRAVLDKEGGLRTGRLLSQVIVFQVPGFNRLMIMTDAAINIAPTLEHKTEICRNAIEVARAIGIENPNLAALCALEFVNPEMPATLDAASLTLMNRRGQLRGAYVEGPIALDVPLSKFAAERKAIVSPLVENTDIFVAPDIEAANILYRAVLYFAKENRRSCDGCTSPASFSELKLLKPKSGLARYSGGKRRKAKGASRWTRRVFESVENPGRQCGFHLAQVSSFLRWKMNRCWPRARWRELGARVHSQLPVEDRPSRADSVQTNGRHKICLESLTDPSAAVLSDLSN
jgi:phosphate butyryltransferase